MQRIVLCEDQPAYRAYLQDVLGEIALREDTAVRPQLLHACACSAEAERWLASVDGVAALGVPATAFPGVPATPTQSDQDSPIVFLLDIHLPEGEAAGLALAETVRTRYPHAYIVFVTEQLSAAFRAFRTQPFDFLPKPVTTERLSATLTSIAHHHSQRHGLPSPSVSAQRGVRGVSADDPGKPFATGKGFARGRRPSLPVDASFPDPSRARWQTGGPDDILQVRSAGLIYRIRRDAIRYIERVDTRTYIHEEARTISCNTSVEILERELWTPDGIFLRCHRRTLVNLRYIADFDPDTHTVVLVGGPRLEVGRRYLHAVQGRIRR